MNELERKITEELAELEAMAEEQKAAIKYHDVIAQALKLARETALKPGNRATDWPLYFGALLITYGKRNRAEEHHHFIREGREEGSPEETAKILYNLISQRLAIQIGRTAPEVKSKLAEAYYHRAFGEGYEHRGFIMKPSEVSEALAASPIKHSQTPYDEGQLQDITDLLIEEAEKGWFSGYMSGFEDCDQLTAPEQKGA